MNNESEINVSDKSLQISKSSVAYLKETSGWTLFFAVLGFIFVGILVLGAFFVGIFFSTFYDVEMVPGLELIMSGIYFIIGIIYFFPIYYLYRFSTNMKKAIENNDNDNLDVAFKNIKSHYKFMGIFTIIILAIYILGAIVMVTMGGLLF